MAVITMGALGLAAAGWGGLANYRTGNLAGVWLRQSAGAGMSVTGLTVAPHEAVDIHFDAADWDGVAALVVTDNGTVLYADRDLATTASGGVIRRYAAPHPGRHLFQVTATDTHGRQRQAVATLTVIKSVAGPHPPG